MTETPFGVSKLNRRLQRLVGVYTCQNATLLEITCHGSYAIFHSSLTDGNIPRDSTYVLYEEESIPTWLFATMSSCAALGIAMAISFFLFNVKHRNNRWGWNNISS